MIDKIDEILILPSDTNAKTTADKLERMRKLKNDIIHQSIIAGIAMVENFHRTVAIEKGTYCVKSDVDTPTSVCQLALINANESRRIHMIERAVYTTQYKLVTNFKNN